MRDEPPTATPEQGDDAQNQRLVLLVQAFLEMDNWATAANWLRSTPEADGAFVSALLGLTDNWRLAAHPDARQMAQHAYIAARVAGTASQRGQAALILGVLAQDYGELGTAERLYAEAAEVHEQLQDHLGLAHTRKSQGDLAVRAERLEAAEELYAAAATLYQQIHDRLGLANTHYSQGELASRRDRLADAEHFYTQAATLYEQVQSLLGLANTRRSQGELAVRRDRLEEADARYRAAGALYQNLQDVLGLANTRQSQGELAARRNRLDEAEALYSRAAELYLQVNNPQGLANTRQSQGDLAVRCDRLEDAEHFFATAAELHEQVRNHLGLARTRYSQAELARYRGELEQAERFYTAAAELYGQVQSPLGLAHTYRGQGDLAVRRDQLDDAEHFYAIAAKLQEQMSDRLGLAHTRYSQGELARRRDRLADARHFYATAAELYEQVRDRLGLANVRYSQGELARYRDQLEEADDSYSAAAVLYAHVGDRLGLAHTRYSQGELARYRGRLDEAEQFYLGAADLHEQVQDRLGLAHTRHSQGDLALRHGRLDEAEHLYAEAVTLYREADDRLGLAHTCYSQGELARRRDRPAEARRFYAAAAELYKQVQDRLGLAYTLLGQARLEFTARRGVAGRRFLGRALVSVSHEGRLLYSTTAGEILGTWARCDFEEQRWMAAWRRARRALRLFHSVSTLLPLASDRAILRDEADAAARIALAAALALADHAEQAHAPATAQRWRLAAWRVAEGQKGQALVGLLDNEALRTMRLRPDEQDSATLELLAQLDRVEASIRVLLGALGPSGRQRSGTKHSVSNWPDAVPTVPSPVPMAATLAARGTELDERKRERMDLVHRLWDRHQRLGFARGQPDLPMGTIRKLLRAQSAGLVSYVLLPDRTYAALILRSDGACVHVPLGPTDDDTVRNLLLAVTREEGKSKTVHLFSLPRTTREEAAFAHLGQDLWAPLEASGLLDGLDHLYVIPDGWLRILPFAALTWTDVHGQRRHMLELHTLTLLLSGSFLPAVAEAAAHVVRAPVPLAAIIDPAPIGRLARSTPPEQLAALKKLKKEMNKAVRYLERAVAPEPVLERPVDHARFVQAVNAAGGLLYFGHGDVGGLVLADGLFTPYDVLTRLEAHGPALLGACLLGYEHALHGLDGASTVTALHVAGCPAVLGALWEVPAQETARLLDRVRRAGTDWATGLRQAQCELRDEGADPSAWAAFTLFGYPTP